MISGLIAYIVGYFKFKRLLKQCLIEDMATTKSIFEYKGNYYDKELFINLRAETLVYRLNKKQLVQSRNDLLKSMTDPARADLDNALLEANDLAISRK